jgi:hypothetical protein
MLRLRGSWGTEVRGGSSFALAAGADFCFNSWFGGEVLRAAPITTRENRVLGDGTPCALRSSSSSGC